MKLFWWNCTLGYITLCIIDYTTQSDFRYKLIVITIKNKDRCYICIKIIFSMYCCFPLFCIIGCMEWSPGLQISILFIFINQIPSDYQLHGFLEASFSFGISITLTTVKQFRCDYLIHIIPKCPNFSIPLTSSYLVYFTSPI